ncbi:MAG: NosD domain-containing protein [Mycobacteriales bacterium]
MDGSTARWSRRALVGLVTVAAVAFATAGSAAGSSMRLFVSPHGSDANACTRVHPCRTISHAVSVASNGDIIIVRRGTYHEWVVVRNKQLHLVGVGWPTIDASHRLNGVVLAGSGSRGSSLSGFVIRNANQEGVIALETSWVAITHNVVVHNDQGMFASSPTGECAPVGQIPGDCGEGVHLMSVAHSLVLHNAITGNAGGVLVTDEFGPSFRNVIGFNRIWRNPFDCGITMPGHNPNAVSSTGARQPTMGGVYANLVVHNVVNFNGLKGEGAGILMAAAGPGAASYDNVVAWNSVTGNNLAGITVHSHAPGSDLNGNRFLNNRLSRNNVGGDPDAGVTQTADILVFSAGDPITGTVARDNWISNAFFGVWTKNAHTLLSDNHYVNVTHQVHQE